MLTRRRTVRVLAPLLLLPWLVGGCSSDQDRYCDSVKGHQAELGDLMGGSAGTALLRALPVFRDLQGKAPEDVRDDWRTVVVAVEALRDALDDAHVDAATYDRAKPPAGVTQKQRAAIDSAAAGLTTPTTVRSLASVQQEALDVCHTPLYL